MNTCCDNVLLCLSLAERIVFVDIMQWRTLLLGVTKISSTLITNQSNTIDSLINL